MKIKVLTIRQPWAWLIVNGFKDVENRERITRYRGVIYIHVSKAWPKDFDAALDDVRDVKPDAAAAIDNNLELLRSQCGQIIGCVRLVDCRDPHIPTMSDARKMSPWAEIGAWHWMLSDPRPIIPFPAKGQLGIWSMDMPPVIEYKIL